MTTAPTYFQTAIGAIEHPIAATGSIFDAFSSGFVDSIGSLWANVTGTLSSSQKAALIQGNAQSMVNAGADPSQALSQSASDVQGALDYYGADPSQNPFLPGTWNWIEILLVVGLFLLALAWIRG